VICNKVRGQQYHKYDKPTKPLVSSKPGEQERHYHWCTNPRHCDIYGCMCGI